jgi:outer membrane receptor protein involved in Fe transport
MARAVNFKRHVKDAIAFISLAVTPYGQYINQDKQNDNGIELETEIRLIKNITIRLSNTYVDRKITTYNGSRDTAYFNLLRKLKNSIGINNYSMPVFWH